MTELDLDHKWLRGHMDSVHNDYVFQHSLGLYWDFQHNQADMCTWQSHRSEGCTECWDHMVMVSKDFLVDDTACLEDHLRTPVNNNRQLLHAPLCSQSRVHTGSVNIHRLQGLKEEIE